jgi:hypothetical protein
MTRNGDVARSRIATFALPGMQLGLCLAFLIPPMVMPPAHGEAGSYGGAVNAEKRRKPALIGSSLGARAKAGVVAMFPYHG